MSSFLPDELDCDLQHQPMKNTESFSLWQILFYHLEDSPYWLNILGYPITKPMYTIPPNIFGEVTLEDHNALYPRHFCMGHIACLYQGLFCSGDENKLKFILNYMLIIINLFFKYNIYPSIQHNLIHAREALV